VVSVLASERGVSRALPPPLERREREVDDQRASSAGPYVPSCTWRRSTNCSALPQPDVHRSRNRRIRHRARVRVARGGRVVVTRRKLTAIEQENRSRVSALSAARPRRLGNRAPCRAHLACLAHRDHGRSRHADDGHRVPRGEGAGRLALRRARRDGVTARNVHALRSLVDG
jgi:hypothetical protein